MKILLLGKNGQLGWELQRALAPLGQLTALDRQPHDGLCGNLADAEGLVRTLQILQPDVIVNAAAYTAVDKAETDAKAAWSVNADAPGVLAMAAKQSGALLVHYSTDYVFDGSGDQPRAEDAPTGPLNQYGLGKLAGEQAIGLSGARHLIFRTSWVYGARGGNFAKTMLRLAAERETLRIVGDQIGAPTGAELIADVTAHALRAALADPALCGTYHLAAAGAVSWHGYACYVFEQARLLGKTLALREAESITSADYPTPASRPLNSRLDVSKLQTAFGLCMPDWHDGVRRMLNEYLTD